MIKNPHAKAGDTGWIPGSGRSPGGGNGNPLEYSCLGNPMDSGAWRATVHGVTKEIQPSNVTTKTKSGDCGDDEKECTCLGRRIGSSWCNGSQGECPLSLC